MILLNAAACSPKSKNLKLSSSSENCCQMMPDIETKYIIAQRQTLSPEIFSFLIQAKATKACACLEESKQAECYGNFK